MNNPLKVLVAIEFKRFMYSNKKIDTLRDYVTFFIRDWRSVLVKILDACCGSKMFYFDKTNPNVTFMDIRRYSDILCDGRKLEIKPDIIGDFRNMQFSNDEFDLVVFDPPHLIKAGKNSWLAKKYGLLDFASWQDDLSRGFNECMRVLKPCGTLIFKWNEEQVKLSEVLKCFNQKPLFGNKRSKTHWLVFVKNEVKENA